MAGGAVRGVGGDLGANTGRTNTMTTGRRTRKRIWRR